MMEDLKNLVHNVSFHLNQSFSDKNLGRSTVCIICSYFFRLHKKAKAAADVEYPAYGVTGPNKESSSPTSDGRLAQSAQMYHYQHQKQQIIAMEHRNNIDNNTNHSGAESEDDNEEGDYTVYECPGLAPVSSFTGYTVGCH